MSFISKSIFLALNTAMLLNHSTEQLRNILNTALWIIMDPWKDQSYDDILSVEGPMNQWNGHYINKIFENRHLMENKIVACDDIQGSPDFLQKSFWISHSDPNAYIILDNLMKERNLDSIILCGFHEQMCVLSRPLGYHHINSRRPEVGPLGYHNPSRYKLYIEWNLTCPMPRENWREEQLLQRAKEKYKYIDILSIEK
jgi:hypothetical protein